MSDPTLHAVFPSIVNTKLLIAATLKCFLKKIVIKALEQLLNVRGVFFQW